MSTVSSVSIQSEDDLLKLSTCRTYRPNHRLPDRLVEYKGGQRFWQRLSLALAFVSIILTLVVLCVSFFLWIEVSRRIADEEGDLSCPAVETEIDGIELYKNQSSPFTDLSEKEIRNIETFLHAQEWLALQSHDIAEVHSNYVHLVELLPPKKKDVLSYLDGTGPRPPRMARAFVFRGNHSDPIIEEYVVGPLPNPTTINLVETTSRKTRVPYSMRPFSSYEFKAVYKSVLPGVLKKAGKLLKESYNASMFDCGNQCLKFSLTPISSGFLEPGKRKAWFWFAYDVEFYTLHPLDFQFLVDMSLRDPRNWSVERVFYANQLFSTLDELLDKYETNLINKTRTTFPEVPAEDQYSAVYMRGKPIPSEARPPPQQIQPMGPRFQLRGNLLEYMDWKLNLRISPTVGLHLYDVKYRGERILYELSMQEIGVLYSGHSPAASMLYFADSAGLFGTRMRGMMPGVDCPEHALLQDALVYTSNTGGLKRLENSVCIFEHSPETPLRRHRAYSKSGAFYSALNDHVLVIRMYICIINYDYVFDFVLHNNGAVEVKVSSTGYLAASFYYPEEESFGTRISETVVAGLHHHLFHFKADVDVKGTSNRFHTMDIGTENKTDSWADNPTRTHVQNFFKKVEKRSEKEAVSHYNFDEPKYLLFYKNEKTELGHTPSYRLINKGMTKGMLPPGIGFEPSMSWGRQQLAVTKHKDDEMTSSSMFAIWDAQDPVVNFKKYIEDDENIVDEDLVAWVTLGMYHIPQTENVPNTATVGTTQSFFLTPFNYFREDPSLASRDAVKVMPKNPARPLEGASVDRHGLRPYFKCHSEKVDERLNSNSTFLFS
ncbi:putative amine oxidase [copper-containing] [Aplysia californica]|uniref:Amine oxidase n=1 Tax=Aplysia californica TaxID=6500 RepID=A0ABM0ZZS7_APLCA|nr:putative amine oxidase [copper-containing] [Aplysia californica]